MKTIEQKALAYDEALEKAKKLYEKGTITESIGYIFPELEKSEDERIRTAILNHLKKMWGNCKDDICGVHAEDAIAWLEKQEGCEHIRKDWLEHIKQSWYKEGFIDGKYSGVTSKELSTNDAVTLKELIDFLENGTAKLQHDLTRYANWLKIKFTPIEKQGEKPQGKTAFEAIKEKPADNANKVEPKFHEGDWIVWENKYYKVNYNGCGYELVDQNGLSTSLEYGTVDENAHFWDITKDAKDGDVLVSEEIIFIFNKIHDAWINCHCSTHKDGSFMEKGYNLMTIKYSKEIFPATKEQRDILMKAMADAGYEWDAEKKELKKVEPKFKVKYAGKEDEQILLGIIGELEANKSEAPEYDIETYDKFIEWLKSIKERVQPQPKQEWSDEDEKIALSIEQVMNCASLLNLVPEKIERVRAWLESIKDRVQPQKQWKPSEEQIKALHDMNLTGSISYARQGKILIGLYNNLKEL